jgi:hypothetical protein
MAPRDWIASSEKRFVRRRERVSGGASALSFNEFDDGFASVGQTGIVFE